MEFIIIDITGIVTFIKANTMYEAGCKARELGYKPFIIRQI